MNEKAKSWLENYWYYYKWHTLAGILVLLVIIVSATQCATTLKPDLNVMMVTQGKSVTTDELGIMERAMSGTVADYNKDGVSKVRITYLDFHSTDVMALAAAQQKMLGEFSSADQFILIMDEYSYRNIKKLGVLDKMSDAVPEVKSDDGYRVLLSDLPVFKGQQINLLTDRLYFGIRLYKGTSVESKKNKPYYDYSVKCLKLFLGVKTAG